MAGQAGYFRVGYGIFYKASHSFKEYRKVALAGEQSGQDVLILISVAIVDARYTVGRPPDTFVYTPGPARLHLLVINKLVFRFGTWESKQSIQGGYYLIFKASGIGEPSKQMLNSPRQWCCSRLLFGTVVGGKRDIACDLVAISQTSRCYLPVLCLSTYRPVLSPK
ncbi:hypothetical protein J6590_039163 [Homalodisca vitripennis]|nr:hypothetical protein J6590_039163 [Homalodisca vitripennis]